MFLASKLNGGLGVSSFFALNRALLLKWVWRFISGDGSLWCKVIQAIYGSKFDLHVTDQPSIWCSILREVKSLKDSGFDFSSHFSRLYADSILDKEIVVANKRGASSVQFFSSGVDCDLSGKMECSRVQSHQKEIFDGLVNLLESILAVEVFLLEFHCVLFVKAAYGGCSACFLSM
ncbi:hypothetical protein Tco_1533320 [Tanacetum coccineum]